MNFDRQYWDNLRFKYKADGETETSPILEMILAKAELGIPLINFEEKWLESQGFSTTLQIIQEAQKCRSKLSLRLQANFTELSLKYKAPCSSSWRDNPLYYILLKINLEESLTDSEINWLQKQPRTDISRLAILANKIAQFVNLKSKYQIINRPDLSLDSSLNQILEKLDLAERLTDKEVDYLNKKKFEYALKIFQEQEASREVDFARLKDKYQATSYPEASISNPLYNILKKIDTLIVLTDSETEYLINNQLIATHFVALKIKYKATSFEDLSPNSHFYKILKKLESKAFPVPESDINFLKKRKLNDILNIYIGEYSTILTAKINSKEQLNDAEIEWLKQNVPQIYFSILKSKYDVSAYQNNSPDSPLYEILQKLEKGIRLDAINVAFLRETELFWIWSKIYLTYHTIEALFYEEEYKQNGNQWNLPSISSHWRKAEQPKRALKITDNTNFEKIKENKLKSAILTTRGGAFRDLDEPAQAEKCAKKAIEYQPDSHHPYTLMGAICYDQHRLGEGDYWFAEAIKRGASPRDIDTELKQIVKNTKDRQKRKEVIEYLLKKDSRRYAWAKHYLSKDNQ